LDVKETGSEEAENSWRSIQARGSCPVSIFVCVLVDSFLSVCVCVCKRAFIAGVADDQGFGWAIAKALSAAGAEILVNLGMPRDLLLLF
jgi:hypothetical protein